MRGDVVRIVIAIVTIGLATLSFADASIGQPATEKSLQLEAKIPLGNVAGRIDHMAIDLEKHRLFVAELGNDSIGVRSQCKKSCSPRLRPQGTAGCGLYSVERLTLCREWRRGVRAGLPRS